VNECGDNTGDATSASASAPVSETFTISLKHPYDFLLEKNEIMDKKFLQWKMYNEHGRADIAKFIGQPFSKYSLKIFYYDGMKQYANDFAEPKILTELNKVAANTEKDETIAKNDKPTADNEYSDFDVLNDSHSMIVGNRYMIKVDSVLRCPIFESNDSQVYDIDNILTSFYDCSDSEPESQSESDNESESDGESDNESESESDNESDNESESDNDKDGDNTSECNGTDPEFEIIEDPSLH
jgi:hypothetical protein